MQVYLKKFDKEDAEFVKENFSEYFLNCSIENIEKIIEKWKQTLGFCIMFGDEKVGLISLSEKENKKLSWGIMIKKEFQGKGIAQKAFDIAKKKAKEQGYKTIISSCLKNNTASKKLHEKVGFDLVSQEKNSAGNEMYRWEMEI